MKTVTTTVLANRKISPDFYELVFSWKSSWGEPVPGNFLELKVNNNTAPMLRRPFAFSGFSAETETASLIYQVRGTSTNLLTEKREGDSIGIIAPLGNGFSIDGDSPIIAVAGGVGLGPILFAANEATKAGKKVTFVTVRFGKILMRFSVPITVLKVFLEMWFNIFRHSQQVR